MRADAAYMRADAAYMRTWADPLAYMRADAAYMRTADAARTPHNLFMVCVG